MTDEQKFMTKCLADGITACGEMLADMNAEIGTPSLSVSAIAARGVLAGIKVRLTLEIVDDKDDQ